MQRSKPGREQAEYKKAKMFVNCAAGGSKASPPGWMPEAKTVGGPAGGISTICPLPTVETKTLPFVSMAICRGDNKELAIVV